MDCQQARAELLPHAFDGLEDADRGALETHLRDCQDCEARSDQVREALDLLEGPADRAPEGVLESLLSRIAEQEAREASRRDAEPEIRIAVSCIYCKDGLSRVEAVFCGSCLAPHHPSCFEEHGKCANIGCEETRTVRPLDPREPSAPPAPHVHAGKPGIGGKESAPRRRSKIPRLIGIVAASTVVGVALVSVRDRPAKLDAIPPIKPRKPLKITSDATPALPGTGPVLAPLRSVTRQVLPEDIVDVAIDRQGRPWFTRRPLAGFDSSESLFLSFRSTLEAHRAGDPELVLLGATYRGQDDFGRAVAEFVVPADGFDMRYVDGLWTGPKPTRVRAGSVTLASRQPFPPERLPPGLELPDGLELLTVDGHGRVYARARVDGSTRLVVHDPWAEGRVPGSTVTAEDVARLGEGAIGLVAKGTELTLVDSAEVASIRLEGREALLEVKLGGVLLIEGADPSTARVRLWRPTDFKLPVRKQIVGEIENSGQDLLSALGVEAFVSAVTPVELGSERGLAAALRRLAELNDGLRPGLGLLARRPVVVDPKQRVWWFGEDALTVVSADATIVRRWDELPALGAAPRRLRFASFTSDDGGFFAEVVVGSKSRSLELSLASDGTLRCGPIPGAMSAVEAGIQARLDGVQRARRRGARIVHVSDDRVFQLYEGVLSATHGAGFESFLLRDLSPSARVVPGDRPGRLLIVDAPGGTLARLAMIEEPVDRGLSPTILWQRKAPKPVVIDLRRTPVVADGRLWLPKAGPTPSYEVFWLEPHLVGARR